MRILLPLFCALTIFACKTQNEKTRMASNPYWLTIKDSFYFQNIKDFTPDSSLVSEFYYKKLGTKFHSTKNEILDSIIGEPYYLYSWQRQDTALTAFTVITEGFGECFEMRLLVFDKFNKLTSDITVAKLGAEPGSYEYKSQSHFQDKDTFVTMHTKTYFIDESNLNKLSRPIGDTFQVRHFFDEKGKVHSQPIDSNFTSQRFKNKDGFVTEKMLLNQN